MAAADAKEVHLLKALTCNKRTYVVATGVLTVYDDDGTSPLLVLTPTESGGVVTRTPTKTSPLPDASDPGAELHLAFAALVNKLTHTIATEVDVVYDDNGTDVLKTLTPSEASGTITVTPS